MQEQQLSWLRLPVQHLIDQIVHDELFPIPGEAFEDGLRISCPLHGQGSQPQPDDPAFGTLLQTDGRGPIIILSDRPLPKYLRFLFRESQVLRG